MAQDLDGLLADTSEASPPYRVLDVLLKVSPGAAGVPVWPSVAGAAEQLGIAAEHAPRAKELARGGEHQSALWMLQGLDTGDDVVSVLSGLATSVKIYLADSADPSFDLSRQKQAEDAVKKALGIAWAVDRLFGGTPEQRVEALGSTESGKTLLAFYAVSEIALPFLADTSEQGSRLVDQLIERHGVEETAKLGEVVGADRLAGAQAVLPLLLPHLREAVTANEKRLDTLVEQMQKRIPALLRATGHIGEAAGHGVDALPMYHLLGARLVAEAALRQASEPERYPEPLDADKERLLAEARAKAEADAQAALQAEKARLEQETQRAQAEAARVKAEAERQLAEALAAAEAAKAAAEAARREAEAAQSAAEAELARQKAAEAERERESALKVARTITGTLPDPEPDPEPVPQPKPVPEPKPAPPAKAGGSKLKWAVGCVVLVGLIACCGTIGAGALSGVIYSATGVELPTVKPPTKRRR